MAWYDEVEKAAIKNNKWPKNQAIIMLSPDTMYTGGGADGKVQPSKPAAYEKNGVKGKPSIYHEGEIIQDTPNGKKVIPHKKATSLMDDMYIPKTEKEQKDLLQKQKD